MNYSCFGPLGSGGMPRTADTLFSSTTKMKVIQDLDLYFIRQIAHSLREFDLEQKIDLEIKMREGTTKLLAACRHQNQTLEAAKSLVTSSERMAAYTAELQRRKAAGRKTSDQSAFRAEPSKAKVSVSEIRMPLIWKDTDHFKNKGDYRRFSVFCLLKIGTEIYDTVLVNNVDRNMTDICFEDVNIFNHITPGFEFRLEVYSHVLHNDLSIASTPRKIKKKISNSVSRTIGRKLAASLKEEFSMAEIGPKFDLVAHATLSLSDVGDNVHTHDLVLENVENPQHQLPLFGHFCCRLAAQPDCIAEESFSGYLGLVQQVGQMSGCRRMWSILRGFQLSFWAKADDSHSSQPVMVIPVNKQTQLQSEPSIPKYPYGFKLLYKQNDSRREQILNADGEGDFSRWISSIGQHIRDHEVWGQAAEIVMEIPSPGPLRIPSFLRPRHGSLYDETPVKEYSETSSECSSILMESNQRISPNSIRSRSSSTSSAASSISSSTRQNFFFRFRRSTTKDSVFS